RGGSLFSDGHCVGRVEPALELVTERAQVRRGHRSGTDNFSCPRRTLAAVAAFAFNACSLWRWSTPAIGGFRRRAVRFLPHRLAFARRVRRRRTGRRGGTGTRGMTRSAAHNNAERRR